MKVAARDFRMVAVGDKVTRMLAGTVPMELTVTAVDDELIHCGVPGGPDGWTFDRATGVEVDDDLGWGPTHGYTGSFLVAWWPA